MAFPAGDPRSWNSSSLLKEKDGSPPIEGMGWLFVGKIHLRGYPVVQTLVGSFIIVEGKVDPQSRRQGQGNRIKSAVRPTL